MVVIVAGLFSTACKKTSTQESSPAEPINTAKGTAKAGLVTKNIGAAGGELVSADGNIRIIVPANAVQANTQFGIQPISNTLYEEDASKPAYRLLPEGKQFSQPIKIVFKYDEDNLENTAEDFLAIAWQKDDGTWKLEPTVLNKQTKTLTVESNHFSDWTETGGFELRGGNKDLRRNEQATIQVITATDDDLLANLHVTDEDLKSITSLGKWKLRGVGKLQTISDRGFETGAVYTAPATVTGIEKVEVSMEIEGFNHIKDPSAPGGIRRTGKMILITYFTVSDNMLVGTLDGIEFGFFGNQVVATGFSNAIAITTDDGGGSVTILVSAASEGFFNCGLTNIPNKAAVNVYGPNGEPPNYGTSYFACGTGDMLFSEGVVEIKKWPPVGQAIIGNFSGLIYVQDEHCGPRSKMLELRFNVVRTA